MSVLRIYFPSRWHDSTSACPWALCGESGAVLQSGTGTLAAMPKAGQYVGILAADRVLLVSAKAPAGARRQWQTALPYLIEGRSLPDPEENHVVLASAPTGGRASLAIVDKAWLKRVTEACRTAGVPLRYALSEVLLLPRTVSGWTVAWDGQGGFVRTGGSAGMALDAGSAEALPGVLRLLLGNPETPRPDAITVCPMPDASGAPAGMPRWDGVPVPLTQGDPWDWRRAPLHNFGGNLLVGALAPPSRPLEWWPKLRPAVAIVLLLLFVEMLGTNLEWAMLARQRAELQEQMAASFRRAFGREAALVNAPLQMQRDMAELRHAKGVPDRGDFLTLMDLAARPLAGLPAGSVREFYFENGKLEVLVNANTLPELERLQQSLRDAGLDVRAETKAAGNRFSSLLRIRPLGAI
ncbi:MAG TPA: type II secretion system protein GspL [Gallionellaceae bacterium]|nr:type II secretion system protein GspL [Gallionellaceae bacterium]